MRKSAKSKKFKLIYVITNPSNDYIFYNWLNKIKINKKAAK